MSAPRQWQIRRLTTADTVIVQELRQLWSEENAGHPLDDPGFDVRFADWFAAAAVDRVLLAGFDGHRAVGMLNLAVFRRMPQPACQDSCWCYVANAFVLASHRNAGLGSALLRAAQQEARELGAVRIVLSPSARSVPFYQRNGFGPATILMAQTL